MSLLGVALISASPARAQGGSREDAAQEGDPEEEGEAVGDEERLELMNEPTTWVDVIDAFDGDDPIDVNVTLGFLRTVTFGRIQREGPSASPGEPTRFADIANFEHAQNILQLGLDVGVLPDLALYGRLPVILSDDRGLSAIDGNDPSADLALDDGAGHSAIFSVPFNSPTRSGVDYLAVGLAWSILNQNRDRHTPTWVLRIEGRLNIGDPLYACKSQMGARTCGHQGADADGSPPDWETPPTVSGMSRGFNSLHVETRGSWRYRHVEPYAGLWAEISWPGYSNSSFLPEGQLEGYINTLPPIVGELTGGMAIIPYEDREHFQRFTIDMRLMGRYISEGHGYSPLYDALGTSPNLYLSQENLEGAATGPVAGLGRVPFYGMTDTQSHMRFGGMLRLEMRAARYVRFELGGAFYYTNPYIITFADACDPNVSGIAPDDVRRGSCRSGIINPHHRPAIDLPGQRFRVDGSYTFDLFVSATGQF